MAANVSVPNNFVQGNNSVADDVDANFNSITSWINTNAVHLDGTKAFTAVPSGPAGVDPVSADQLTRKSYVDNLPGVKRTQIAVSVTNGFVGAPTPTNGTAFTWQTEQFDTDNLVTVPNSSFTLPAGAWIVQMSGYTSSAIGGWLPVMYVNGSPGTPLVNGFFPISGTIPGVFVQIVFATSNWTLGAGVINQGSGSANFTGSLAVARIA